MIFALLIFSCQNQASPSAQSPSTDTELAAAPLTADTESTSDVVVVSGRIHPSCDGIAKIDALPMEGIDPEPLVIAQAESDGTFTITLPSLTPIALHSSCYLTEADVDSDNAHWRVYPLSLKPLSESMSKLVLFKEGLRPDHSPIEGVTLEEAIEISQIRQAASLPEIIGPVPPEEINNEQIIEAEFFEQGPPVPEVSVQVDPADFEPIRHTASEYPISEELEPSPVNCDAQDDFWTMFYGIEPDKDSFQNCRENEYRPLGTSAAKTTLNFRRSDLQRYYDSLIAMLKSHAVAQGINPALLLPEAVLIEDAVQKGSLYTPETRYLSQRFAQACEILKLHCPPPTLIIQQRFVLNDKRSVQQSDQGAALSAYLWVKSEQLIREAQRQGIDPRPFLPEVNALINASNSEPQSQAVAAIVAKLQAGYQQLDIPFQAID